MKEKAKKKCNEEEEEEDNEAAAADENIAMKTKKTYWVNNFRSQTK